MDAKFYDAKSTNLPVYGKRVGEADIIEGPMEAEPQVCCAELCCAVPCCAVLSRMQAKSQVVHAFGMPYCIEPGCMLA